MLSLLNVKGCLAKIYDMGCHLNIAQQIVKTGGDYLMVVKGNQETLAEDVEQEFKHAQADGFDHMDHLYLKTFDKGHGRIEKWQYWHTRDVEGLSTLERWPSLNGMVMCRATRTEQGKTSVEERYLITSTVYDDVVKIAEAVRAHWGIENGLHWVLDVAFGEDQSRIRSGYAAENIAAIRKITNNALKQCTSAKGGIKASGFRQDGTTSSWSKS